MTATADQQIGHHLIREGTSGDNPRRVVLNNDLRVVSTHLTEADPCPGCDCCARAEACPLGECPLVGCPCGGD